MLLALLPLFIICYFEGYALNCNEEFKHARDILKCELIKINCSRTKLIFYCYILLLIIDKTYSVIYHLLQIKKNI